MRIDWEDTGALAQVLAGRTIVSQRTAPGANGDNVIFTLDNGVEVEAESRDGGCACSNGCFTVASPSPVNGRIMSVEAIDPSDGMDASGETALRVFVLTDMGKQELIVSEGGDNGYYGWGFTFVVREPAKPAPEVLVPVVLYEYPHRPGTMNADIFTSWNGYDRTAEAEAFAAGLLEQSTAPGTKDYCRVYVGAVRELNPRG